MFLTPGEFSVRSSSVLPSLRERIRRLESGAPQSAAAALPFGLPALDTRLPGGGLALGALHEVASGGAIVDEAAAALFAAGVAARVKGRILWCLTRADLFAPALAQAGLGADRAIYVEAGDPRAVLACFEDGLRHGGLGAVVAETARLSLNASRRLQLAAEGTGTLGLALRRRRAKDADFGQPTAARTRWRISVLPSTPLPVEGVGRARWRVELLRCRGGEEGDFELEGCDGAGRLSVPAELADGPVLKNPRRRSAAG